MRKGSEEEAEEEEEEIEQEERQEKGMTYNPLWREHVKYDDAYTSTL